MLVEEQSAHSALLCLLPPGAREAPGQQGDSTCLPPDSRGSLLPSTIFLQCREVVTLRPPALEAGCSSKASGAFVQYKERGSGNEAQRGFKEHSVEGFSVF